MQGWDFQMRDTKSYHISHTGQVGPRATQTHQEYGGRTQAVLRVGVKMIAEVPNCTHTYLTLRELAEKLLPLIDLKCILYFTE